MERPAFRPQGTPTPIPLADDAPFDPVAGLVEGFSDGAVFWLDGAGHIAFAAGDVRRLFGFEEEALTGRHVGILYTADASADGRPQRDLSAAVASSGLEHEQWMARRDGSEFWASVAIEPRAREGGGPGGFVVAVLPGAGRVAAPEARRATRASRQSQAQLAEELHAEVVRRLFRVGLTLYGARSLTHDPEVVAHLEEAVDSLDGTIRYIRAGVLALYRDAALGDGH
jgi:PAS domain S-box-containing protein